MRSIYWIVSILIWAIFSFEGLSTVYYVDSNTGDDSNKGLTKDKPFKSLERLKTVKFIAGDKVLLADGSVFVGTLELKGVSGTREQPFVVGSYSKKNVRNLKLPLIDAKGWRNGILLTDCSFVEIKDLEISANGGGVPSALPGKKDMRCGVLITTSKPEHFEHITLTNLVVKDIFYEDAAFVRNPKEAKTANGTQNYGWGIRIINIVNNATISDIAIENCTVRNVAHTGIKFTAKHGGIRNIKLYNNRVIQTGGPGIQIGSVMGGHVKNNIVDSSGSRSDTRKWGRGSGLWTWNCDNIIIEHNTFKNANGPADSAGCHIDFNCNNVIVQYNMSMNNAGGFCEILGNNYNCAYRYNISVNDGYREKGKHGAFQEGKIFWLSGFNGKNRKRKGPYNSYFYNNTIYANEGIVVKIAVDRASQGVLLANNIFCIQGESKAVLGDQYKPEVKGESKVKNIVFANNLYLKADNWPKQVLIQDEAPLIGDPRFNNPGGQLLIDYIPTNSKLIKDKGIKIEKLPNDPNGLITGLTVEKDILGNKIVGRPDMGAIEIESNRKK